MGCYHEKKCNSFTPTLDTPHSRVRLERRGSLLILVVGVLVLLAIAATLYMGIGQQERVSAAAQESTAMRGEIINKLADHLGQILTDDLYADGVNGQPVRPFEDGIEYRSDLRVGERTDYPHTRVTQSGQHHLFDLIADAWLASTEPEDVDADGIPESWRHWSNINPNGTFNDLDQLFRNNSQFGLYGSTLLSGSPSPYEADTPLHNMNQSFHGRFSDFSLQMDDVDTDDGIDGIPTYADQRYGTDTDGDGRIDARWTELLDVIGFPQGMRPFVAVRVVDMSGLININTSIETGAARDDDDTETVGFARYPSDVDLYTMLLDEYGRLDQAYGSGNALERYFAGGDPNAKPLRNGGYRENLSRLGMLGYASEYLDNQGALGYDFHKRLRAADRADLYEAFLANPQRAFDDFRPYGADDELELRTYWGMSNDQHTSRLEQHFDILNGNTRDPATWLSPFRSNYPYEVDYSNTQPSRDEWMAVTGIRNKVTTFNGQRSVSQYNLSEEVATIQLRPNINDLLTPLDDQTNVDLQDVFGGYAWALLPFALRHDKDGNGQYGTTNQYGRPAEWLPTVGENRNYGNGSANFAYLRAAMLAVNTLDYFDEDSSDDDPTVRVLRYEQEDQSTGNPRDPETELAGIFSHGMIEDQGADPANNVMLIGLEKQPFFREVSHVQIWNGVRVPGEPEEEVDFVITPSRLLPDGTPEHLVFEAFAIELGNPWDEPLSLSDYSILIGNSDELNIDLAGSGSIPAGESIIMVFTKVRFPLNQNMRNRYVDALHVNGVGRDVRFGELDNFYSASSMTRSEREITLWRKNVELTNGSEIPRVMVDRLEGTQNGVDNETSFPGGLQHEEKYIREIGDELGFQIVFCTSMRRNVAKPNGNERNFPPYVMQSPADIGTHGIAILESPFRGIYPREFESIFADYPETLIDELDTDDQFDKGYVSGFADDFYARFQMHVMNGEEIASPFDLLNVSSISHVFIPDNWATFNPLTHPADQGAATRDHYVTISEMLGDRNLFDTLFNPAHARLDDKAYLRDVLRPTHDGLPFPYPPDSRVLNDSNHPNGLGYAPNYFVGRMDYTRYTPSQMTPELVPLAVPLAGRIVDVFDTITPLTPSGLVQGRININTAPLRVLQSLPFLHPRYKAGEIPARTPGVRFAKALEAYRDRKQLRDPLGLDWSDRAGTSRLIDQNGTNGLRRDAVWESGITSLGELALIAQWLPVGDDADQYSHEPYSTNLVMSHQMMTEVGHYGQNGGTNFEFKPLNPSWRATEETPLNDPADDVTEWLIMPRNIGNVVSLRSDIFCAYIKVIGFLPADIDDAMQKEQDGTVKKSLDALKPTLEQRYVVVFDRSNVKNPGDRPRLLFAIQAVPTR